MSANPFAPNQVNLQQKSLTELRRGQFGQIAHIDQPELEIALLKMGVTVGDAIALTGAAPMRGPLAIRVGHIKLSLRREDASHIWISQR